MTTDSTSDTSSTRAGRRRSSVAVLAVATAVSIAATASPALARCLILTQSNSADNTLYVYRVDGGGGLRLAQRVATGGSGNSGVLHSAGSIATVGEKSAFVVNAASNTITSFAVAGRRLVRRHSVASGGVTPKSLWVSGDRLYVLNSGTPVIPQTDVPRTAPAVVRAFTVQGRRLVRVPRFRVVLPDRCRTYPCTARAAYAQVAVTPDHRALVVSDTDGDHMVVARLDRRGRPGVARNFASGTPQPYGFSVTDDGLFVVSGHHRTGRGVVGTGRVVNGRWRGITRARAVGGGSSCWVTLSHDQRYAYVANNGGTRPTGVTSVRLTTSGRARVVGNDRLPTTAGSGPLDLSLDPGDRFLYATFADGVHTFRVRRHVARYQARRSVRVHTDAHGTIGSGMIPLPAAGVGARG